MKEVILKTFQEGVVGEVAKKSVTSRGHLWPSGQRGLWLFLNFMSSDHSSDLCGNVQSQPTISFHQLTLYQNCITGVFFWGLLIIYCKARIQFQTTTAVFYFPLFKLDFKWSHD